MVHPGQQVKHGLQRPVPAGSFRRPSGADAPLITILFNLLSYLLWLYMWAVILAAVFSTLTAFGVLDTRNRLVWTIGDFLYRITEPALRPIRRFLPNLGGIDISPLILILLIQFVANPLLARIYRAIVTGYMSPLVL
ncbi:MAG: YggT family protein [Acetobacteraceae bacterium]|nr:YggT family protein [Acetobacteraceae bacterium]MBV8525946.1 YggT family protein [Acetobacteraceae bacterium]MBV8591675.1 YggT family protein [Acetobacteraceae bacterium]